MKLGILLAGRRPEDIAERLKQAREAGFSLCQLNFHQTGLTRADLLTVADSMEEHGVRPVAIGCYVNPFRAGDPSLMGVCRADLDLLLQSLDIIGARRVVLWSGTYGHHAYDEHPSNADEASLDLLRAFLTDVVDSTRARHYFLVIEPYRTHALNSEQRVLDFQATLEPRVAERVRYVMDAPNLLTAERYANRDAQADAICRALSEVAGIVHLKDSQMPPDGEACMPGPGRGFLDYAAYVRTIVECAPPDMPAIIKNVPPPEFATARDDMLRLSDRWELA